MTGGFDYYLSDLRGQLTRCADEAAPARVATDARSAGAARRRPLQRPAPRRALAWAAVLRSASPLWPPVF